jgi:enamine deaminase RidA (YjgF/YER057c/UK114 family)
MDLDKGTGMNTTDTDDTRATRFAAEAARLGYDFSGPLQIGGNYVSTLKHGGVLYISGQVPRVGSEVVVVGEAGSDVTLERAQHAAQVCAMRALVLIAQAEGSLDAVQQVLGVRVYTRSAPGFTQQSEVANAASDLLVRVLGPAGTHTRTSVGVAQLPKGAAVELDMTVAVG